MNAGSMNKLVVCVFAKPPIAGTVKTRLAADLGAEQAALMARAFFLDTWELVCSLPWARPVLATTHNEPTEFGLTENVETWLQGDGDLGVRLQRVACKALTTSHRVLIIGADSPGLPAALLEQGREALKSHDAVLGPAEDGGFCLVGLRHCPPKLFAELPWSAPTTFEATKKRFASTFEAVAETHPWFDIDTLEDLQRLRQELQQGSSRAAHTQQAIEKLELLSCPAAGGFTSPFKS